MSFLQAGLEWETGEKKERISTLGLRRSSVNMDERNPLTVQSLSRSLFTDTHTQHRVFIFLLRHACTHWENSKGHIYY